MIPGNIIALPQEPPIGSRLRLAGLDDVATEAAHLDVVHRPEGWYYAGFLDEQGEVRVKTNRPWDWDYVISTHKRLIVVVCGDNTWKGIPS